MWWPFRSKKQPVEVVNKATVLSLPGPKVRVTLVEAKYFSRKDLRKLGKALAVLCYVVNHPEFTRRVSDMIFTSTEDSAYQVLDKIFKANELGTGDDYEIDYSLQYYNSWWSKVIGYTLPTSLWIWLNWKYHLHFKSYQTAGNLKHEQLHKLGYDHASASDHKSVPYAIGYLVEALGEKYEQEAMLWLSGLEIDEMWK